MPEATTIPRRQPTSDQVQDACAHCAAGHPSAYRQETREWVHRMSSQSGRGVQFSITLCGVNGLRKGGRR